MLWTMRGYLKSLEGTFVLRPKTTTVGGHPDSDLCLENGGVKDRHALIELSEAEHCFVLRDLNSAHGTFVNDCRIHNAAVRLAPGDELRFGYGGLAYKLAIDNTLSRPPMIQRSAWQNPLHLIEESKPPSPPPAVSQLPFLPAQTPPNMAWIQGASATAPHPPVRARPASAGARRPGHHLERGVPSLRAGSWTGSAGGGGQSLRQGPPPQSPQTLEHLLQEKEERLLRLGDEVSRLLVFEAESKRKDTVIASLRDDISALKLRAAQARGDSEITQKLQALEREIMAKKEQIQELKEQIMDLQRGSSEVLKHSFKERDLQISNLKNQLEKLKRDHGMSTGLVTSLQRDLSAREQQSLRLSAEVDKLHKDVRHKDAQLGAMSAKFSKMRETKKHEEELLARENEVIVLKKSVEEMERRMAEMRAEQGRSVSERETMNITLAEKCQVQAELQQEAERLRHQLQEMSRQEQRTRVELEQALARLQRFRSRIIQATYTAPGVPTPQDALSDQQVTEQMTVIIEERDELKSRVQDLQGQLDGWTSEQDKTAADTEQLKRALQECQARVQEAPSVPGLQREIAALRDQGAPPSLSWVRALALSMLSSLLSWQQEAARALQDAGIDVAASANGVSGSIRSLWQKHKDQEGDIRTLQAELEELRVSQDALIQARVDSLNREHERTLQQQQKTTREVMEQQNQQLLQQLEEREQERDRLQQALSEQHSELGRVEDQCRHLTQAMEAKRQEVESLTGRQQELSRELQSAREREADLQQEAQRQQACWPAKDRAAEERGARLEQERQGVREAEYREQVHQHARTIVALEQRLARAAQSQRAGEEERAALEARLREAEKRLESRSPSIPPAPPVPVLPQDVEALKQTSALLRAELAEAQREAAAQRDTIAGLSRDLAGAHAKMSDMAGELSEQQKLELEQHRALVAEQRSELSVLRQRLAQMSQLVEQKGQDLLRAEEELRLCKADLEIQVNVLRERELQSETPQEDKRASSPDPQHTATGDTQDQSAAAELADLGAKCKGHRHEEVIQRQREALAELRARIKALEQTRPQRSSPERAVQQVALKRRELSELRAQQAVADSLGPLRAARELSQTSSAELPLTEQAFEETLDRTARLDLSDALDLSERTYRDLVKALSGALELGELYGCASLKHLPPDERDRLGSRRQQDLELLLTRLRVLHGQAQRKEELLSEYQADLRRLRESQAVGQQLQAELDRLRQELQSQTQESSLLREALERAQQRLEQEKSLNRVIKERKPLLKEQLERRSVKTPSHSCVQEDTHGKAAARKASLQGRLKKKEYEIETLKKQLRKQGQEMCTTSSQLANLQNALASSETR